MDCKRTYRVAGLDFSLSGERELVDSMGNYRPFEAESGGPELFFLEMVHTGGSQASPSGLEPMYVGETEKGFPRLDLYRSAEGWYVEMAPLEEQPLAGKLEMDGGFKSGRLTLCGTSDSFAAGNSLMLMYAFAGACENILEMHASVVMHGGKGYMFLGRSGTGKSTHSSLWLKHIPDTELLNDDNPIVRVGNDGGIRVYGSPWSGKTPCYKNKNVPLGGIVRLSQAPENRIKRLSLLEAYASVMASCSSFRPISQIAEYQHKTISSILASVPCWHLECLPDEAAARLCEETITGQAL